MTISRDSLVVRSQASITARVKEELLLMDVTTGCYFSCNETAAAVWDRLAHPLRVTDLCLDLMRIYAISPESCEREVLSLLNKLRNQGLVRVVTEAEEAPFAPACSRGSP
jgi:hypothetical protein